MAKEKWSQIAYINVLESAPATLTFAGLSVFSNILSNQAMIIHRAEYTFRNTDFTALTADQDQMIFGICGSNTIETIVMDNPEVYDYNDLVSKEEGTPEWAALIVQPKIKEWTGLPGHGLLVPADRLFAYVKGISIGSALELTVRVFFSLEELAAADYLELAQAMRVLR